MPGFGCTGRSNPARDFTVKSPMKLRDFVANAIEAHLTQRLGSRELGNLTLDGTIDIAAIADVALNARKRWHRATDPSIRGPDDEAEADD